MALKRPRWDQGTLVVLEHDSKSCVAIRSAIRTCASSPCGFRPVRPGRDARARQALSGALRPRGLHRLGPLARRLEELQRQRARARRAPDPRKEDGARDHGVPRLLHGARRQPVRELVGDRQLRRLPHEGDRALRRPRVPHARLARPPRLLRQVLGRLRRDHPRHEVPLDVGRDRRPFGRRVLRLRLLARLAQHAERARQVPPAPCAAGQLDVRKLERGAARGLDDGRVRALPRGGVEQAQALDGRGPRHHEPLHGRHLRSGSARAQRLPPAVQPRDRRGASRALEALARARPGEPGRRSTAGTSSRCAASTSTAAARDQYHIHYGTRILSKRLAQAGIEHTYEEFDDNHSDVDYRMDVSLPFLARALR